MIKALIIAAILALAAAGGGRVAWLMQDGKVLRAEARAKTWRSAAEAWQANATGWKASFDASEDLRAQERTQALNAVNASVNACDARVNAVRASTRALKGLLAQPVKADGKGCPVRELWTADVLRPVLRPAVR